MNPSNVKMSMSLTDNTTYAGKDALGFYSKALLEGDTKSMIKLIPDVKSKVKLPRLDLANILQESDCTFGATGSATLSQKTLEVCPIKINLEFCTRDFEVNFLSEQLRPGSLDAQMPSDFQSYILDEIAKNVNTDLETLLWQGNSGSGSLCDGLLTLLGATGSGVISVTASTLSATNIIAEIGKVYSAIPNTIANKGKVVIFVSVAASKYYKQALAALNNALIGTYNNGDFTLSYIDIPVVVAPGMPTNKMVAAEPDNFWYGTDLVNDIEDILVIPQRDKSGAPTVRIVAEFKFGVQFGIGEEVVLYA